MKSEEVELDKMKLEEEVEVEQKVELEEMKLEEEVKL